MKKVAADTNSAYLMGIWNLPETQALKEQTLGKLSRAPWLPAELSTNPAPETAESKLLLPLLEDLLNEESWWAVQQATNQAPQGVVAVQLTEERSAIWRTNLQVVLGSLGASNSTAAGLTWSLALTNAGARAPVHISLSRSQAWTVVRFSASALPTTPWPLASVLGDAKSGTGQGTNSWLSFDGEAGVLGDFFPIMEPLLKPLARVNLAVFGDGEYVRTRGTARLRAPMPLATEPWQVPVDFLNQRVSMFTAARGLAKFVERQPWVRDCGISSAPDQLFSWAFLSSPMMTCFAMPATNAAEIVTRLGECLPAKLNDWITNYAYGMLSFRSNSNTLAWDRLPILAPELKAAKGTNGDFLMLSLVPLAPGASGDRPAELLDRLASRTNLLYYNWEVTQERISQWLFLGQLGRFALHRQQIPTNAPSIQFFVAAMPRLGPAVTEVAQPDAMTLTFARGSHLGLTAFEMNALADWMESPQFPRGLYTLVRKLPARPPVPRGRNTPAAPK
jgi:hypothetical protein